MFTAVTLDFGDGSYRFWLPMARIVEIERLCGDKSILAMHDEFGASLGISNETQEPVFLGGGNARIRDVYEVIRCAAIGGNECEAAGELKPVSAIDAKRLADEYVDGRPLAETLPVAWAILNAAITGPRLKKKAASEAESLNP